ncbi:hypothetical protein [Parabacteroides sp.]
MADILCRLKLTTDEYEKNLRESKRQMQEFTKKTHDASGDLKKFEGTIGLAGTGLTKFLGAMGLAATATGLFKKTIDSSQTLTDEFGRTTEATKTAVNTFFNALSLGDFSIFTNSINEAITSARQFYDELDRLASIQVFNPNELRKLELEMAKAKGVLYDKSSTESQKKAAREQLKALNEQLLSTSTELSDQAIKTYYADLRNKMRSYGAKGTEDQLDLTIDTTLSSFRNYDDAIKRFDELDKKAKGLMKEVPNYVTTMYGTVASGVKSVATTASKSITDSIEYTTLRAIKEMGDDALTEAKKYENMALSTQINVQNMVNANLRKSSIGDKNGSSKKKDKDKPVEGSIDYINAQIAGLTKKLNASTDEATRYGLRKAIEKFNKEKHLIELEATIKPIESKKINKVAGKNAKEDIENGNVKIKPIVGKDDVKVTNEYNNALSSTLSMMLAVGNATNEGAAGWITYGTNSLMALNDTYQALAKVIPALQVKALMAGAASAAETPIVGWITAIAAIGAMTAAFASLPKYETGGIVGVNGIVPGSSFSGDKILARVNAGELILNRAQQKNIAAQLVPGGGISRVDVNVTGRISGRDLEFVQEKRNQFKRRTQ